MVVYNSTSWGSAQSLALHPTQANAGTYQVRNVNVITRQRRDPLKAIDDYEIQFTNGKSFLSLSRCSVTFCDVCRHHRLATDVYYRPPAQWRLQLLGRVS